MKVPVLSLVVPVLALVLCGLPSPVPGAPAKPAKPSAAAVATNAPAAAAEMETPQSLFTIPAGPKEGRNPFFPRSSVAPPAAPIARQTLADASAVLLNGIIPNGPRSTAMINGRTFEKGEEAEIKLPTGAKVLIKCVEIKDDSVVVLVNGAAQRELRLRSGLQ